MSTIERVSAEVRQILEKICPEVVAVSRSLSNRVYYIPVSATGSAPVKDEQTGKYMIRTDLMQPIWCEVPLLLTLGLQAPTLVVSATKRSPNNGAGSV